MMRDPAGTIPEHPIPFSFEAEARTWLGGLSRWLPLFWLRWF